MKQRGPLIGILTGNRADGSISGNSQLFTALQEKLISENGSSFIFTLEGVEEEYIAGYSYLPEKNLWKKVVTPYPDLVYNRIPFRKVEQREAFHHFLKKLEEKRIPYFNPCFINKHQLYQLISNHPILNTYLPDTMLVENKNDLSLFLNKHKSIYLKPAESSKGNGIFRLKLISKKRVLQERRKKPDVSYSSFSYFWNEWQERLKNKTFLAQANIHSAEFNGNRFDFRILAHARDGSYSLTGVGIRQSQEQEITTHIPSGGRLLPYKLVQSASHDRFIREIIPPIGEALTDHFGFFGEFSIDAGVSQTGDYYIYEVNSKPMSFDEPEIEEKKIEQLCRLFQELTQ